MFQKKKIFFSITATENFFFSITSTEESEGFGFVLAGWMNAAIAQ